MPRKKRTTARDVQSVTMPPPAAAAGSSAVSSSDSAQEATALYWLGQAVRAPPVVRSHGGAAPPRPAQHRSGVLPPGEKGSGASSPAADSLASVTAPDTPHDSPPAAAGRSAEGTSVAGSKRTRSASTEQSPTIIEERPGEPTVDSEAPAAAAPPLDGNSAPGERTKLTHVGAARPLVENSAAQEPAHPGTAVSLGDVMPILDRLCKGHLGPVAVDVQLLGSTSLLQDPVTFSRILDAHETASSVALQRLLSSVRPFFLTRRSGFYTLDHTVYPVLPILASVLQRSALRKIVANASLLYRLLFLFLGTDRIDVANVVDVQCWSSVLHQTSAASDVRRDRLLPCTASGELTTAQQLSGALPPATQMLIDDQARSLATSVKSPVSRPSSNPVAQSSLGEAFIGALNSSTEENDLTPSAPRETLHEGISVASEPPAASERLGVLLPSAQEESVREVEKALALLRSRGTGDDGATPAEPHARDPCRSTDRAAVEQPNSCLPPVFAGLSAAVAYYDAVLQPMEGTGLTVGGGEGGASGPATAALSAGGLCEQRTYAVFLCAVMTFHGLTVDKALCDEMAGCLDEQVNRFVAEANECLAALGSSEVDGMHAQTTAGQLLDLLSRLLSPQSACAQVLTAARRTASATPSKQLVLELRRRLLEAPRPSDEDGAAHVHLVARVCERWLAAHERLDYRNGKLLASFMGVGDRLRVCATPAAAAPALLAGQTPGPTAAPTAVLAYSVHPSWTVHNHSTGRIFASAPNVQTVAKEPPTAEWGRPERAASSPATDTGTAMDSAPAHQLFPEQPSWTLRHLYRAPRQCALVSFDFNQVELRVLAHLCRDPRLVADLKHTGSGSDVLAQVARMVFLDGETDSAQSAADTDAVRAKQRQAMKVIVYGLIYGMGPELMDTRLKKMHTAGPGASVPSDAQAASPPTARELIAALYRAYPGIQNYLRSCRLRAVHDGQVETLSGPKTLAGEPDPNRRKQRAVAWAVQGGAADILHAAMRAVHAQRHRLLPYFPAAPLALLMTVHDELIYAVPEAAVEIVVPQVKRIIESQAEALGLRVPLRVSVKVGPSLGELHPVSVESPFTL